MNKEIEEKISALMDGDLSATETNEAINLLCADKSLREQWQRMHLTRDIVQGESAANFLGSDFSASVMAALENEETPVLVDDTNVVPVDFTAKQKAPKASPSWMKPVAGLAVAASVAMVSVMSLKLIQEPGNAGLPLVVSAEQGSNTFITETTVAQLPNQPISNADFKRVNNTGTYWVVDQEKVRDSELESHLNSYLSDHIEFATMRNVGGMLPYSKLVGYDEIRK